MMHRRRWVVVPIADVQTLAEKLTKHTWCGCQGFSLDGYTYLNDATSADGGQEYGVLKPQPDGSFVQIESITFSWCTQAQALKLICKISVGDFDADNYGTVRPKLDEPGKHGTCHLCA